MTTQVSVLHEWGKTTGQRLPPPTYDVDDGEESNGSSRAVQLQQPCIEALQRRHASTDDRLHASQDMNYVRHSEGERQGVHECPERAG